MSELDNELGDRAAARIGTVLRGKYRLDRVLGVGGMAAVFAATHLRNANSVAVKILHRELAIDPSARARFVREGYAANSVRHAGTVRILDDDTAEDGSVFLVMDLLEGETLDARWERNGRRLPVGEVLSFTREILDVIAAAHDKGVIHRDLKPENLFVTLDRKVKVLDFGIARLRESAPKRTSWGAVIGTPAFMPPEQALGRTDDVDALSDIWAIGATAFSLLAGRVVHRGETAEAILVMAATQAAPPLRTVAPHVPAPIADVLDRALAFEKADRWPDARAMRSALVAAQERARQLGHELDDEEVTDLGLPLDLGLGIPLAGIGDNGTIRLEGLDPVDENDDDLPDEATIALPSLMEPTSIAGLVSPSEVKRQQDRRVRVALGVGAGGVLVILGVVALVASLWNGSASDATATAARSAQAPAAVTALAAASTLALDPPSPTTEISVVSVESLPRVVEAFAAPAGSAGLAPTAAIGLGAATAPVAAILPTAPSLAANGPQAQTPGADIPPAILQALGRTALPARRIDDEGLSPPPASAASIARAIPLPAAVPVAAPATPKKVRDPLAPEGFYGSRDDGF